MKKTLLVASILAASFTSTSALAGDVSANVAATSNYLWRGQEQTGGDAAISGGIDYADESGFYAGTWVSNASWADEMTYEMDFYAGFGGDLSEGVSYDVGYVYYAYPDASSESDSDFSEIYGSVSMEGFTLGVAVLATSAADGDGTDFGDSLYISADYGFAVGSNGTEVTLHAGHYSGDFVGDDDIIDFGVSVSKDGFTFGLSDTDMDGSDMKAYVSYAVDFDL
ncbi:TorF family putative porin [Gayadomonas joobiniege]|uniref:TorF family putative porin n=1 Tax=Gayadomonas joobiniege TaxID=1234606 RepID=UPI00037B6FFA|nr:TorF family putative porin [Gayadomonas joobiniege]